MSDKYEAETAFWRDELDRYVDWYAGRMREFYGIPRPKPSEKIDRHPTARLNALETWVNADRWRYCWHLFCEPSYFAGKRVLEIGPGPLGLAQWFIGAELFAAEPLTDVYREAGYPIDQQRITYVKCFAEALPFHDQAFDAVISVNAIDHVDDFEQAVAEIERVVKPDGEVRIETHFHAATTTEPCVLTEDRVLAAFRKFNMERLSVKPSTYFYPPGTHPHRDQFVLWSNKFHLFPAMESLR